MMNRTERVAKWLKWWFPEIEAAGRLTDALSDLDGLRLAIIDGDAESVGYIAEGGTFIYAWQTAKLAIHRKAGIALDPLYTRPPEPSNRERLAMERDHRAMEKLEASRGVLYYVDDPGEGRMNCIGWYYDSGNGACGPFDTPTDAILNESEDHQ